MLFKLKPAFAALCAAAICTAGQAAAIAEMSASADPEIATNTRTIVIEDGVVVENAGKSSPEVFIAQAGPEGARKEVKIIRSGPGSAPPDLPDIDFIVSSAMSEAFASAGHGPFAKTVKNAPYSAEVITEKNQPLPDGNQITRRTSAMTYRDSAGRTRQETRDAKGEVKSIHINDAVEGARYVLSPSAKSATKLAFDRDLGKRIEEIKERAKALARKSQDAKAVIVEHPGPGQEIIVKRIEAPSAEGKKDVREEVKVNVVRAGGPGGANVQAFHFGNDEIGRAVGESMRLGPIGMSFQDGKWSAKATTTQLGTRDIEGVHAEGKSVSYTIPAGEIGNKNPITVTTETWYSPELQATVYSKSSDPRVGETIYRLANVKRGEQPASLFAVPEGYALKEAPALNVRAQKGRD